MNPADAATDGHLATFDVDLPDAEATEQLGARIAAAGDEGLVLLRGDLGAGKTTLVRGFLRARGHTGAVKSPTYTLVEEYPELSPPVLHFDLYRLNDPMEFEEMGGRDYLAAPGFSFVEWPDRADGLLPAEDLGVELFVVQGRDGSPVRRATVTACSARGERVIEAMRADKLPKLNYVASVELHALPRKRFSAACQDR